MSSQLKKVTSFRFLTHIFASRQPERASCCINRDIAIKPASHTTERHSANCFMSRGRSPASHSIFSSSSTNSRDELPKTAKVYSTFSHEMRQAVAQPKMLTDFEAWREKFDVTPYFAANLLNMFLILILQVKEVDQKEKPVSNGESTVEVGDPTFSSTPKHPHQASVGFLACSSKLEDTGTKPKRSLKFPNVTLPPASTQRFYSLNKPTTEFVASLTAIFNSKKLTVPKRPDTKHLGGKSTASEKCEEVELGFTATGANCVSRGTQCCVFEEPN